MQSRLIRNIALAGFMGTGKTAVGRVLAELLRFRFLDTDEMVAARSGLSIPEIFANHGEEVFRKLEREVAMDLGRERNLVISTGGGLVAQPGNLDALREHALVVCLWASPETILHRVGGQAHRPLLQTANPLEKIRELLAQREPFYRQADILVNTELRSIREVALHVHHHWHLHQQATPKA